jgi:hypothetical protein
MLPIAVRRSSAQFLPDPTRVIAKPFSPGDDVTVAGGTRTERILERILALTESEVGRTLRATEDRFTERHMDLRAIFEENFASVARHVRQAGDLSLERRLLIGAYFTHEYSVESAALSNPSVVVAPDQAGLEPGQQRIILSLRAIGEGHLSSIQFRSGIVNLGGKIAMDAPSRFASTAVHRAPIYEKAIFRSKLEELHVHNGFAAVVLDALPERFALVELETVINAIHREHGGKPGSDQACRTIHWLASSNYESSFSPDSDLSERVLFPAGPAESRGMEDARFVRFTEDDGAVVYFASYTAFDGYQVLPQLIETKDFVSFRIATLNGPAARNKGIALFPRRIDGRYAALSRVDNENNFFMSSDNVRFWYDCALLQTPARPWEITQIGNCGSPIETEADGS